VGVVEGWERRIYGGADMPSICAIIEREDAMIFQSD
jgi:hypothetical protein